MKFSDYKLVRSDCTEQDRVDRAADSFYLCEKCGDTIPSMPTQNQGCKCGNIIIDKDYFRLVVEDFSQFKLVRKKL
jgi:hypothetical protein